MSINNKPVDYEHLITILSIAGIISLVAMVYKLTGQFPDSGFSRLTSQGIAAYEQPKPVLPGHTAPMNAANKMPSSVPQIDRAEVAKIQQRFDQAVVLLHAKQYKYAITALDAVLRMQPDIPEVYVNMGYAYLGLNAYDTAASAFSKALDIKPGQANAYYGLAIVAESNKDYEVALGAMRSYIHLVKPDNRFLTKARSAIWEWEEILGRNKGVDKLAGGVAKPGEPTTVTVPQESGP